MGMIRKVVRRHRRNENLTEAFTKLTNLNVKIGEKVQEADEGMVTVVHKGDYSDTRRWLNSLMSLDYLNVLASYGAKGVELLRDATPKDTGLTANSWTFDIVRDGKGLIKVVWYNTNEVETSSGYKFNVALLIQTGHATRSGTWVEGIDYINPALKPLFDQLANEISNEVRRQ